eukprot:1196173-Prorocentrum_minimum.AAC.1
MALMMNVRMHRSSKAVGLNSNTHSCSLSRAGMRVPVRRSAVPTGRLSLCIEATHRSSSRKSPTSPSAGDSLDSNTTTCRPVRLFWNPIRPDSIVCPCQSFPGFFFVAISNRRATPTVDQWRELRRKTRTRNIDWFHTDDGNLINISMLGE